MSETLFRFLGYQVQASDLWIIATAIAAGVASGLVGCFLVLKRLSLMGDAISHAILPGLAGGFIVFGDRNPLSMLTGAMVVGTLTALSSAALKRFARVPEDAALGVVFSSLFAIGVVMISIVARQVDLDPGCVLYGLLEFAPFDTIALGAIEVPRAFLWLSVMCVVNTLLIGLFYKELKLSSFDPYLATSMGFNATAIHYVLMVVVAATAVAAFEAVGSILVIAMLVAPGATAHLLTDRLSRLLFLSALLAAIAAILGYILAVRFNTSVAGMIASLAGVMFVAATLLAPRYGLLAKWWQRTRLRARIFIEDLLTAIYRVEERRTGNQSASGFAAPSRLAMSWVQMLGYVVGSHKHGYRLTANGRNRAQDVLRSHRLWESYLAKHLQLPLDHLHEPSHRIEHFISDHLDRDLDKELGISLDPHGKVIPPKGGDVDGS